MKLSKHSRRAKGLKQITLASVAAFITSTSQAAIHCEGFVQFALLYADGSVNIQSSWRGDYTVLCNTNGTWRGIAPEICLAWYAAAASAAKDGKPLAVYYDTNAHTCANVPTYWSALAPVYVGLKRQ